MGGCSCVLKKGEQEVKNIQPGSVPQNSNNKHKFYLNLIDLSPIKEPIVLSSSSSNRKSSFNIKSDNKTENYQQKGTVSTKNNTTKNSTSNKTGKRTFSFFSAESNNDNYKSKIQNVVEDINYVRTNPKGLILKIKELIPKIQKEEDKVFLRINNKINIKLSKGESSFEECLNYLQTQKSLNTLIFKEELSLEFPEYNPDQCDKKNYLTEALNKKNTQVNKIGLKIINFHYDLSLLEPELSVLMQIIDDTNFIHQRRKNIFNSEAKYIGVNIGKKTEEVYCYYIIIAKDAL
ncbi:MAG: hypothetical protein MJ252_07775 [archaeon]|nr:hypothetical protein [archaeon]